jgi:hypothetical protein
MAFLSLSRGDPAARELLERAIRARYGLRPPALDSRRIWMTARGKGPLGLPVSIHTTAAYIFPNQWRWEQTRKLFGLTLGSSLATLDRATYYEQTKSETTKTDDPRTVDGMRKRLWAEIVFSLTSLTLPGMTLKSVDDSTFTAMRDVEPEAVATIHLNADDSISVETAYYQPAQKQDVPFKMTSQGGLQTLEGFVVPKQIIYQWGTGPGEVFTIVKAEANPTLPPDEFELQP